MTISSRPLPNFISGEYARMVQAVAYTNGKALENHVRSAHGGKFCETCPACNEIRERENEVKGER